MKGREGGVGEGRREEGVGRVGGRNVGRKGEGGREGDRGREEEGGRVEGGS